MSLDLIDDKSALVQVITGGNRTMVAAQHGRGEESAAKCFRFVPLV